MEIVDNQNHWIKYVSYQFKNEFSTKNKCNLSYIVHFSVRLSPTAKVFQKVWNRRKLNIGDIKGRVHQCHKIHLPYISR